MVTGKSQAQTIGQASPAPLNQKSEVQNVDSGDNLFSHVGILPLQQYSDESEKREAGNLHAGDSFHVHRGGIPGDVGDSVNEQSFYSDIQPVSGNADSAAGNSSDRKNEVENEKTLANAFSRPGSNSDALLVSCGISDSGSSQKNNSALREVNQNDRTQEIKTLFQEPESGIQRGVIPADSFSGLDAGPDNRGVNFEVKNGLEEMVSGQGERVGLNRASICPGDDCNVASASCFDDMDDRFGGNGAMPEIAPSARLASPANQASFDAGNYPVPHVQNDQEKQETATCANSPQVEEKPNRLTGRELTEWAIKNYAVDPIQNSKNRWRIRLRCRKTGCKHEGHLGLKTVSFMSDSAFQKVSRGSKRYADWKKQIKAENAAALCQSN